MEKHRKRVLGIPMNEELNEMTVEAPKPKQYLIMADEMHMALLGKLLPGLLFVQVEGMAMQGNDTHMLLVNPIVKVEPLAECKAE